MSIWKRMLFIAFALLIFIVGLGYVTLHNSGETITYKQSDFINYHILTDKDISNAPRITSDFYFESSPGDGSFPTNSITFKNAQEIQPIETYLRSLGLKKENRKMGDNDVWSKHDDLSGNTFYLSFDPENKSVTLTKSIGR
ncbi:hypothetical protein EJP617_15980 [Erwinia sp. Ejp617]|nr:hypothetical protein [Erwinia sp. Ejp617]ADP11279.1 hypothetical protein EJP617_15980 [Erwinia sp. Ejp617]